MATTRAPLRFIALLSLLLIADRRLSSAQESGVTATLRGTVTDTSSAVVPGAQVTLTNAGTKVSQAVATDAGGSFAFAALWPGEYALKVELSGFKTVELPDIVLSPNDMRGVAIQLEVGSTSETLT